MYYIYSKFTKKIKNSYINFLKEQEDYSLLQTLEWGKVKSNWKQYLILVKDNSNIKGSAMILVRKLPYIKYTFMYSPRGPIYSDEKTLEQLVLGIKELAKIENAFVFKADPLAPITDKELFKNYFILNTNYKDFNGIQPKFISELNLIKYKNKEEIINSFHSKTRYNIRLAERKNVTIEKSKNFLDDFYNLMIETGKRDNFNIRSKSYFKTLLNELDKNAELYVAKYNNQVISGAIVIKHGKTFEYLYGASSNAERNTMPNYLLQWTMIQDAFNQGFEKYSFGGISGDITNQDNPLYGLYKFKSGFNTQTIEYLGEIEIVFNKTVNFLYNIRKRLAH